MIARLWVILLNNIRLDYDLIRRLDLVILPALQRKMLEVDYFCVVSLQ